MMEKNIFTRSLKKKNHRFENWLVLGSGIAIFISLAGCAGMKEAAVSQVEKVKTQLKVDSDIICLKRINESLPKWIAYAEEQSQHLFYPKNKVEAAIKIARAKIEQAAHKQAVIESSFVLDRLIDTLSDPQSGEWLKDEYSGLKEEYACFQAYKFLTLSYMEVDSEEKISASVLGSLRTAIESIKTDERRWGFQTKLASLLHKFSPNESLQLTAKLEKEAGKINSARERVPLLIALLRVYAEETKNKDKAIELLGLAQKAADLIADPSIKERHQKAIAALLEANSLMLSR